MAPAPIYFERKPVFTLELPFGQRLELVNHRFEPRQQPAVAEVTILTGLHGDELDGGLICHLLSQFLQNLNGSWRLHGTVNILPNANPLSSSLSRRFVPLFGSDLNRNFPGDKDGHESERLAAAIFELASRSFACIDIHSSNSFLEELPQVRVVHEPTMLEWARSLGLDIVWSHSVHNWIAGTVAQTLFERGVQTLVVEVGTGCRLNRQHCERVFRGIVQFLGMLGVLSGGLPGIPSRTLYANETNVAYINAELAGLFVPAGNLKLGDRVRRGACVGQVIEPLSGQQSEIIAPFDGILFTLRVHPVVYAGSLIARLVQI